MLDDKGSVAGVPRSGPLKRLYDWMMHWAGTPQAVPALFFVSMIESSVFPIPPDPLLMAMGLAKPKKAVWYATVCTTASVIGGAIGYAIGYFFMEAVGMRIIELYGFMDKYAVVQRWYEEWNAVVVFVAGVSPIPYKLFTIAGGAFAVNFPVFIAASIVGRGLRFYTEGILIYHFGEPIRAFIDRYITILSWLFAGLVVAGFIAVKFMLG